MKILVTGGNGTMGRALREFLPDAKYLSRQECDVRNDKQLSEVFNRWTPDVVIHAAAITDHQHPNASEIIETNIIGSELVARWCKAFQAKMVYLSTHYVYPGETGGYKETDKTQPIGVYAWSKLAGEGWAQTVPDRLIVRGSWYTPEKVKLWAAQGAVADALTNRETPPDAAEKIASLVIGAASGIYNIGGRTRSFADIAESHHKNIVLVARAQFRGPYAFPKDSSVDTTKYTNFVAGR